MPSRPAHDSQDAPGVRPSSPAEELRQAQEALSASEERFRCLVAHAHDWDYWMAPDKSLVYMSPSCLRVTGYEAREFLADPGLLMAIVDPLDRELLARHLEHMAGLPPELALDFRIRAKNGQTRWVSHACQAIFDVQGTFLGRRVSNRDITERKRMETELRESKELLDALLQFSPAVIALKDTKDRYVLVNPLFAQFVGRTPEDIQGRTSAEVLPPKAAREAQAEDQEVIATRGPVSLEKPLQVDGKDRHFLVTKFPLGLSEGVVRGVGLIATDITERKLAEEALRESEARFRIISESAMDAIIMTDDQCRVEYWNPAAEEIFGFRLEELANGNLHDSIALPRDRTASLAGLAHFQATGQGPAVGKRLEFSGLHKSGRHIPVELTLSSIQVAGRWHAIAIVRDITERKRNEVMREDLERIARHDLKAPLNALINLPDLIGMEGGLNSTQRDYLNLLKESGYRMLSMIDSSLNLLKLEQGTYTLAKSPVELVGLARKIGLELGDLVHSRRAALSILLEGVEPPPGAGLVILGEEMLLHSLLANLIKNALEASPASQPVTVSLSGGGQAVIEVRNLGLVPDEVRERFFEKYATSGKRGGTGLGTYSARLITEVHGGTIAMDTSPEQGTLVRVMLPGPAQRLP